MFKGSNQVRLSKSRSLLVLQFTSRASLSENCSLLGTDNVRGQISVHRQPKLSIRLPSDVTLGTCKGLYGNATVFL